ncbi:GNAT family N-acetyltransferase [Kitasatospora sp. NPDC006697]|uniref:GNAT family N-acetyltransferase n=1 Tax=Kitasatospora sp. NPDC006697 TaxID=3364020 RepID=UPI0036BA7640
MADYRIRRRWSADLPGCVRALAEVHEADGYPQVWPSRPTAWLVDPDQLAGWVATAPDGQVVAHVALVAGLGSSAARVWATRTGRRPEETAAVTRLYVAPSARGRGLGAGLLDTVAEFARQEGLCPVLDVVTTNTAAVELYERQGWEWLVTIDQQWPDGQLVEVHCYALEGCER